MPDPTPSGAPIDEERLIDEAKAGSRFAFRVLVERHMRNAYNLAYRLVRDHDAADDIAQEAFVRAYEALPSFRKEAEFHTWLYRIVMNLSLNSLKASRRKHEHEVGYPELLMPAHQEDDFSLPGEINAHIEHALHELPTMQRAAVILRHVNGLSTRQVSGILQCSEGTVKTHLFRGLEKLRRRLHYLQNEVL